MISLLTPNCRPKPLSCFFTFVKTNLIFLEVVNILWIPLDASSYTPNPSVIILWIPLLTSLYTPIPTLLLIGMYKLGKIIDESFVVGILGVGSVMKPYVLSGSFL
jgi:hypothetical protein